MFEKLKYLFFYYTFCGFKDKDIDEKFYEWKKEHSYKQISYISTVTGVLYILISTVNRYTAPVEISSLMSNIQLFLISPLIFFISYLAYKKYKFIYIEFLLFSAPIYAASIHLYIISHLSNYSSYQTELYLMIFWIYTISGLRFIHSIITSLIVFFIGISGAYIVYPNQLDSFIIYTSWMSVSLVFGFAGGYLLQESQKSIFLKQVELEKIAITDKLTGLYNRVMLDKTLHLELEKAYRYKHTVGILVLDIDFFKAINDNYGHLVGDKVLIEVSAYLKRTIRSSDMAFRWGGEEFIILCTETNKENLMIFAEHIRKRMEEIEFDFVGKKTISIGASISVPSDGISSIVKRADEALYIAKNSGRNCVKFI